MYMYSMYMYIQLHVMFIQKFWLITMILKSDTFAAQPHKLKDREMAFNILYHHQPRWQGWPYQEK